MQSPCQRKEISSLDHLQLHLLGIVNSFPGLKALAKKVIFLKIHDLRRMHATKVEYIILKRQCVKNIYEQGNALEFTTFSFVLICYLY